MKVRFKDGAVKSCTAPTEQKLFRGGNTAGWALMFSLTGEVTSSDLDELLNGGNISELAFLTDTGAKITEVNGYNKVSSCTIRHAETPQDTRAEIQLTKGV